MASNEITRVWTCAHCLARMGALYISIRLYVHICSISQCVCTVSFVFDIGKPNKNSKSPYRYIRRVYSSYMPWGFNSNFCLTTRQRWANSLALNRLHFIRWWTLGESRLFSGACTYCLHWIAIIRNGTTRPPRPLHTCIHAAVLGANRVLHFAGVHRIEMCGAVGVGERTLAFAAIIQRTCI